MAKGIKTPFNDSVGPPPTGKPTGKAQVNGEPGLPKRTPSPNSVDEVVRC